MVPPETASLQASAPGERIKVGECRTLASSLSPLHSCSSSESSSRALLSLATMSGCGSGSCSNGDGCQCSAGCGCCKALGEPTFGGLRNYNAENDCNCGPDCNCADCDCHK